MNRMCSPNEMSMNREVWIFCRPTIWIEVIVNGYRYVTQSVNVWTESILLRAGASGKEKKRWKFGFHQRCGILDQQSDSLSKTTLLHTVTSGDYPDYTDEFSTNGELEMKRSWNIFTYFPAKEVVYISASSAAAAITTVHLLNAGEMCYLSGDSRIEEKLSGSI